MHRSVSLPLVMDSRGYIAPPTVWPSSFAVAPAHHTAGSFQRQALGSATANINGALWLPGWGTFIPSSPQGMKMTRSSGSSPGSPVIKALSGERGEEGRDASELRGRGAEDDESERWRWLGVLTAMSESAADDATPFLRLGGSSHTDMSGICHEVSTAEHRGRSGSFSVSASGAAGGAHSPPSGKSTPVWRGQQKALVEAALEEGMRMVHVPGLEGNSTAGTGTGADSTGGAGGAGAGTGASWPGPAGYSFVCWMRFNPPDPSVAAAAAAAAGASKGTGSTPTTSAVPFEFGAPEPMGAWCADVSRATASSAPIAAATSAYPQATVIPMTATGIGSDASGSLGGAAAAADGTVPVGEAVLEDDGDLPPVPVRSPMLVSVNSSPRGERGGNAAAEKEVPDWMTNSTRSDSGKSERRQSIGSVDSGQGGPGAEEDESVVRPHLPGRQVILLAGNERLWPLFCGSHSLTYAQCSCCVACVMYLALVV